MPYHTHFTTVVHLFIMQTRVDSAYKHVRAIEANSTQHDEDAIACNEHVAKIECCLVKATHAATDEKEVRKCIDEYASRPAR